MQSIIIIYLKITFTIWCTQNGCSFILLKNNISNFLIKNVSHYIHIFHDVLAVTCNYVIFYKVTIKNSKSNSILDIH